MNPPRRFSEQAWSSSDGIHATSPSTNPGIDFDGNCSRTPRSTSIFTTGWRDQ